MNTWTEPIPKKELKFVLIMISMLIIMDIFIGRLNLDYNESRIWEIGGNAFLLSSVFVLFYLNKLSALLQPILIITNLVLSSLVVKILMYIHWNIYDINTWYRARINDNFIGGGIGILYLGIYVVLYVVYRVVKDQLKKNNKSMNAT